MANNWGCRVRIRMRSRDTGIPASMRHRTRLSTSASEEGAFHARLTSQSANGLPSSSVSLGAGCRAAASSSNQASMASQ